MLAKQRLTTCLWFDGQAEEAARFYVSLLPDSRIDAINRAPGDYPAGQAGKVLLVEFTLAGQKFQALNGGPQFQFTEAISMSVSCADQAEVDRLWSALTADGGKPAQCGWLKDRYGLSWRARGLAATDGERRPGTGGARVQGDDADGQTRYCRTRTRRFGLRGAIRFQSPDSGLWQKWKW